ncbi:MAG TPA: hypothetical protein VM364_00575 [Vicinamibacterales bacterium]|nr:hypothetical protein [Vicinamibacterales bacterium]
MRRTVLALALVVAVVRPAAGQVEIIPARATLAIPGVDTQVIFNDGGTFGATSGLTFNKTTDILSIGAAVRVGDGSASAPSFTFGNSTNTGWYRASNQVNLAMSGVNALLIENGGSGSTWTQFRSGTSYLYLGSGGATQLTLTSGSVQIASASNLSWGTPGGSSDLTVVRDAADTLALRRGANAQTFRLYGTFTDASNYERLHAGWDGDRFSVMVQQAGTGTARAMRFGTAGNAAIQFRTNNTDRWTINGSGHLLADADNTYDIGASLANRPRNLFIGGFQSLAGVLYFTSRSAISSPSDGVLRLTNNAENDFNRLQFGGTTSSFPGLKRNGAELQVRLADDSVFASFQSMYQRVGSGSPEGAVTAPVGAIYHRTDGGAGTSLYVKESGTGTNTGWVAK